MSDPRQQSGDSILNLGFDLIDTTMQSGGEIASQAAPRAENAPAPPVAAEPSATPEPVAVPEAEPIPEQAAAQSGPTDAEVAAAFAHYKAHNPVPPLPDEQPAPAPSQSLTLG